MKWLSRFYLKESKPSWEYSTKGVLWRLLVAGEKYFVAEDRDISAKQVSFFALHQDSGQVEWQDIAFDEKWWIGLEALHADVVFLHEFATPDMPEHKKIHALDLSTGKLLWTNDELRYLHSHEGSVYASKDGFNTRKFFALDSHTGEIIKEVSSDDLQQSREPTDSLNHMKIEFPMPVNSLLPPIPNWEKAISTAASGMKSIEQAEFIRSQDRLVVGFYERIDDPQTKGLMDQHVVILEGENYEVLYRDTVNKRISNYIPDALFCKGDFVYYIKDKNTLRAKRIR